ncbi:hypothetical protein [Nocardia aobensis]|uniref:hypothetical protein n=1 Tax=Nocardia aobensis TaxID=257277 RepID=UPI000303745F|nr:hypothetical protein [Nocardia aobensis]
MKRTIFWALRAVTLLTAASGVAQSTLAGEFLSGSLGALDAHSVNGSVLAAGLLIQTAGFGLARLVIGSTGWAALISLMLTAAAGIEMMLGRRGNLAVHVPLGVLLTAGLLGLFSYTWRNRGLVGAKALGEK